MRYPKVIPRKIVSMEGQPEVLISQAGHVGSTAGEAVLAGHQRDQRVPGTLGPSAASGPCNDGQLHSGCQPVSWCRPEAW